jgi:hypothetical protein
MALDERTYMRDSWEIIIDSLLQLKQYRLFGKLHPRLMLLERDAQRNSLIN